MTSSPQNTAGCTVVRRVRHFVKMVHNGIEYGMMAAIAEGLGILEAADAGTEERQADAETAPLDDPRAYQYDFDIEAITELRRRGSVINSWLIDLTANALADDPQLSNFAAGSPTAAWAAGR